MSKTDRLIYLACSALSRLPWWMLYALSSFLAWLCYTFRLYRYKVVIENLRLAFPDMSPRQRRRIARRFYRHLGDSLVESVKLLHVSDESLRRKVEFVGWNQLDRQRREHRSVVLYLGHYGNWELVPTIVWAIPDDFIKGQIYKPAHHPTGVAVMEKIRSRFGAENINQEHAFLHLIRQNRAGHLTCTGFIADQRPNGNFNHWTTFLGLPTAYTPGGEEIGRRINADYYYIDLEETRRGHTRLTLIPITPDPDEPDYPMTVGYLRLLEKTIRRDPALWLWTHKRWSGQLPPPTP
ncbi:MAG: lysophospholipid acyltransferase family protein [Bacteroides sp.]|nr:lysophospholipid acyltransferase family protein [Bacteroides sp.]MCM1379068.1 lysophospholipid acyltransferase family protein [Bacteroides sp.]MCM1445766.1 lysophospholipid acyltransferase family protein [Prevotella sp.]